MSLASSNNPHGQTDQIYSKCAKFRCKRHSINICKLYADIWVPFDKFLEFIFEFFTILVKMGPWKLFVVILSKMISW